MQQGENRYWREASSQPGRYAAQDSLEDQLRRRAASVGAGFDLAAEVAARPLLAFGAALAVGFLLGSAGDDIGAPTHRDHRWLRPIDDELEMLKSAALATVASLAADNVRQLVPGQTGQALSALVGRGIGGGQTSSAPNTSFDTGAGRGTIGHDSPPAQGGSAALSNTEVRGAEHLDPYYPPGGAAGPIAGGERQ
jgi:hypothetical protein